ncbi:hypothetical protein Mco01_26390 [Microbispora corallina]|uniref:Uncharacterized protein n=1 Tax=Microbispora corallina TaxID=83302 RepID=A0ABQ4FXU5_9ACTN|nr:hypothetical protein Mco01_26390 [Microbispora corallina]
MNLSTKSTPLAEASAYAGEATVMAAPAAKTAAPVAAAKASRKPFLMVTPNIGKIEGKVGFEHRSLVGRV